MKALLVDDERLARAALRRMLQSHADVEIVGEAANGMDAARQIRNLRPDVVFLDVEMPGVNGLELLERLETPPNIVFTTAFSEYAARAFDANALDYLIKPIAAGRLATALDKLRKQGRANTRPASHILLREGDRSWVVPPEEVYALCSEGNYTRVFFGRNRPLIYSSLKALEGRLDPSLFFRVSRLYIANLCRVVSLERDPGGGLAAVLDIGLKLRISRRRARRLRKLLGR